MPRGPGTTAGVYALRGCRLRFTLFRAVSVYALRISAVLCGGTYAVGIEQGTVEAVRYSWTQPICERDWIVRNSVWEDGPAGDMEVLVSISRPVRVTAPLGETMSVERCSFCGEPTIWGVFTREDPANVRFPAVQS